MAGAKVKPRFRVKAGGRVVAFDAGKAGRRLRAVPTAQQAINTLQRSYGPSVLARSRYLAANNPYTASAKEAFVSAMVGSGIVPSPAIKDDPGLKEALQEAWLDWTDESDFAGIHDFYGQEAQVAGELFEAGECFVRFVTPKETEEGAVPLQLQVLPAEMLDFNDNHDYGSAGSIQSGIRFDGEGRRTHYRFWKDHPAEGRSGSSMKIEVPAEEVLHIFRPIQAGQIRGLPFTLSAIVTMAVLDAYEDAELERKRIAALFTAFVTRPNADNSDHPLEGEGSDTDTVDNGFGLEPGAVVDLEPGEAVDFAEPTDVGGQYEAFMYRNLLRAAAGFGVPYAAMTGDLRQTSFGSIRAGLIEFRRRIEALQHQVMVFQFCRPVRNRWLAAAVLAGAVPISPQTYLKDHRRLRRTVWHPPKWDWIDPLKDLMAEVLAVDNGFKARDDVISEQGFDPEEVDRRIQAGQQRAEELNLVLPEGTIRALVEAVATRTITEEDDPA